MSLKEKEKMMKNRILYISIGVACLGPLAGWLADAALNPPTGDPFGLWFAVAWCGVAITVAIATLD